jgi:hypothetical protein
LREAESGGGGSRGTRPSNRRCTPPSWLTASSPPQEQLARHLPPQNHKRAVAIEHTIRMDDIFSIMGLQNIQTSDSPPQQHPRRQLFAFARGRRFMQRHSPQATSHTPSVVILFCAEAWTRTTNKQKNPHHENQIQDGNIVNLQARHQHSCHLRLVSQLQLHRSTFSLSQHQQRVSVRVDADIFFVSVP